MSVRIHIERIVVDAAVAAHTSPRALRESIQGELTRLVAVQQGEAAVRRPVAAVLGVTRGPGITAARDGRGVETGKRIGAAIHAAIGGRGGKA